MFLGLGLSLGLSFCHSGRYCVDFGFGFGFGRPGWCAAHWLYFRPPSHSALFRLFSDMIQLGQRSYPLCRFWGWWVLVRCENAFACGWHCYLQVVSSNLQFSAAIPSETVINCFPGYSGSCCIVDCSFSVAHLVAEMFGPGRIIHGTSCYDLSRSAVRSI